MILQRCVRPYLDDDGDMWVSLDGRSLYCMSPAEALFLRDGINALLEPTPEPSETLVDA